MVTSLRSRRNFGAGCQADVADAHIAHFGGPIAQFWGTRGDPLKRRELGRKDSNLRSADPEADGKPSGRYLSYPFVFGSEPWRPCHRHGSPANGATNWVQLDAGRPRSNRARAVSRIVGGHRRPARPDPMEE